MCLAVPMRVIEIDLPMGTVELDGVRRRVHVGFLDGLEVGDYVLVHAGCAVERLHAEEAEEDLRLLRMLLDDDPPGLPPADSRQSADGSGAEPRSPEERGA